MDLRNLELLINLPSERHDSSFPFKSFWVLLFFAEEFRLIFLGLFSILWFRGCDIDFKIKKNSYFKTMVVILLSH